MYCPGWRKAYRGAPSPGGWKSNWSFRRVDLGRAGLFVNDGLQQYKRNWGFVPVPDPLTYLTAVWLGSDAARQAFRREPVLLENGGDLPAYGGEAL